MKTVRRPPYPKWNPGYFPCSSLTPLPLSSRRPSVSFGGFGLNDLPLLAARLGRPWRVLRSAGAGSGDPVGIGVRPLIKLGGPRVLFARAVVPCALAVAATAPSLVSWFLIESAADATGVFAREADSIGSRRHRAGRPEFPVGDGKAGHAVSKFEIRFGC